MFKPRPHGIPLMGRGRAGCPSQLPSCITRRISGCSGEKDPLLYVRYECVPKSQIFLIDRSRSVFGQITSSAIITRLSVERPVAAYSNRNRAENVASVSTVQPQQAAVIQKSNASYDFKVVRCCTSKRFSRVLCLVSTLHRLITGTNASALCKASRVR